MGTGRYLGMPAKYTVLLFERASSAARYSNVYLGGSLRAATRRLFPASGSWLFLTAAEYLAGDYANDTALACEVAGGVAQILVQGFRGASAPVPFPVGEGVAHWFSHRIDARYHFFAGLDAPRLRAEEGLGWEASVRSRVEHGVFVPSAEMLAWTDGSTLEWADHLVLWSRFDYLIAREDGAAGSFLRRIKEPRAAGADEPGPDELAERARQALAESVGVGLESFDALWSEWVLRTYPKQ
jgi:hypothetical protein